MYNMIYVFVECIWPQVYSRCSFIFIFLLTDTIYSCLSYCGCIVIPLFTSIIEENTLKAPLKRLSDSRSSHIWITNVAGSPRTEVMLVKGWEGTLTMVRWYQSSDVSIQHGSIGVRNYRPINRSSPWMRYPRIVPPTPALSWARATSLVMPLNALNIVKTSRAVGA